MAYLLNAPFSYFVDVNGLPLAGGKVYTYEAGTTTAKATYTDSTGVTAASNPVILDSTGIASIWISGAYNIQVRDANDVLQPHLSADNITSSTATGDMVKATYDAANIQEQLVGLTAVQTLTNKTLGTETIAVTQAAKESSTKIATTAYVQGEKEVYQTVNTQTGAVATGVTPLPFDDTIPQNTEGDQFMSLDITPTSATSKLLIHVVVHMANDSVNQHTVALFQDTTANALAASHYADGGGTAGVIHCIAFTHYMTAGTTSATTFKVRAGAASGTTTFNGSGGARKFGGVLASSITIQEIR